MTETPETAKVPVVVRDIARQAFAGRSPMADGTFALPSERNPWRALDDALAAVYPLIEAMVRAKVAEEIASPLALSNAEMAALARLDDDERHEECAEVWQRHFARIARGEQP